MVVGFHRIGFVGIVMGRGGKGDRARVVLCGDFEDEFLWGVDRREHVRGDRVWGCLAGGRLLDGLLV